MDTRHDSLEIVNSSNVEESVSSYETKSTRDVMLSPEDTATHFNNVGVALQKCGLKASSNNEAQALSYNERASAAYRTSLKMKKNQFGNSHPTIATTLNNLASVYFSEGHYHCALKYYNKSLDIMTMHLGRNDPNVATIWHNIGDVHRAMQRSNLAIICFERALAIRREYFYECDVRVVRLVLKINALTREKECALLRQDISDEISKIDKLEKEFKNEIEILLSNI